MTVLAGSLPCSNLPSPGHHPTALIPNTQHPQHSEHKQPWILLSRKAFEADVFNIVLAPHPSTKANSLNFYFTSLSLVVVEHLIQV